jgi:predicted ArsR family transcriptional regulator
VDDDAGLQQHTGDGTDGVGGVDDLAAVALLAEPARRALYELVRSRDDAVGREEAAHALGISVKLAAFHLDRMAEAGLLDVSYRRLTGRVGPGAGRPAKLYRPSARRISVSIPTTNYQLASQLMATALSGKQAAAGGGPTAVRQAAATYGRRLGEGIRAQFRSKRSRRAALTERLADLGFEPQQVKPTELVLRNCAFADLAESHRDLVCGMNAALVAGVLEGAELTTLQAVGGPSETTCCVRVVGR